jgi:hypothetical protein
MILTALIQIGPIKNIGVNSVRMYGGDFKWGENIFMKENYGIYAVFNIHLDVMNCTGWCLDSCN